MTDETIEVPSPFSVHHRPSKREATAATATAAAEEQMGLCGLCAAAAAAAAGGAGAGIGQGTDSLSGRQRRTSRRAAPRLRWLFRWLRISSSSKKKSSTQQLQSSPACKPPPIVSTPPHKPLASSAKEVKFQQKQASQKSKSILYPSSITSSNGGGAESSAAAVVISSADNVNNSNCKLISDDNISVHWNPTVDDQQSTFARSSGHHVLHSHHSHYTASIYSSLSGVVSELDEDENNNGEEVNSQIDDHDNNSGVAVNDDDGVSVTESVSSHDAPLLLLNSKAKSPSVKSFNPSISSSLVGTRSIHTTNRPCDASTIAPSTRAVFSPSIRAKKKHPTQSNIVQITPIPPPSKLLALDLSSSTNTNSPTNAAVSSGIPATAVSSSLSNVLSPGYPLGGSLEGAKPLSSSEAANVAGPSSVGHPMTASARNVTFPNDLASIHTAFSFGEKSISIWSNEAAEK